MNKVMLLSLKIIPLSGILFCMTSCNNDPKEIDALVNKSVLHEDKAHDVTVIYSEEGRAKAKLYAKEFIRNDVAKPPYTDMKRGVRMDFFNDSLLVESVLTARYARFYEKQGNALIRDSIIVINKKGERLDTEELVWNQQAKKIYTEKFVKITTATQVMYGDGLEANEDFTLYEIKNPKGIVQINKKDMPQ
jgi:LPS export ABC transporter protein LptC